MSISSGLSAADAERRLARRAHELAESRKRLAGQLRLSDDGERSEDTRQTETPN
ncbi:MAG TPA: hypothetical protein VGH11_03600 [Jatrophihabitans sp.]|jgi:hypothetical protein